MQETDGKGARGRRRGTVADPEGCATPGVGMALPLALRLQPTAYFYFVTFGLAVRRVLPGHAVDTHGAAQSVLRLWDQPMPSGHGRSPGAAKGHRPFGPGSPL